MISQRNLNIFLLAATKGGIYLSHIQSFINVGRWASGDYEITIKPGMAFDEIIPLIKQTYPLLKIKANFYLG